ncbi:amino acid/amide ABC transporter substrate-binding protein (HAAT family) [Rhodovulum imhoffii]|uniref:Amino acid/amide ABC transporter substrate-binding protein (HAAT family) n=1 Tax=Rhodovulum imhoffii TaxID=365340 RepID=A0A2T5BP15_9RHOB|nr:penicillin-binding protein activator [Rhodovulum imhoffii]MBK5933638.1 penicillin-binding protein activator [Rhodovulum imhoffii]PTN00722.1 amino acid/amide ABC transporter substrate-binding protein (HAAT family) [Rhodovulum imhoffii]
MFALFSSARKMVAGTAIALSVLGLAACDTVNLPSRGQRIDTDKPVPVALLVPGGSGQGGDAILARDLENAARLAMADLSGARIELRVYNTAGNPARAAQVAQTAVEEGAKIILGPVYAQAANAAGLAVASKNVNVLSFSNNSEIAGGNVFILGQTFDSTARRLARFAVRQGRDDIMVIHGQNLAGEVGRTAIERAVTSSGGRVVGVGSYEFSQNGVVQAAPRLSAAARENGAEALFLTADSAGALPLVTQLLRENGMGSNVTQYIGLTRWDIPPATVALPGVQGGWFALPDPDLSARYKARFQSVYGHAPHPISGLAYDGIAAIGALVRQGKANALTAAGLTQGAGFVGVNGVFRLHNDGTNERGLAVAQIRDNQVYVIDPAPRRFGGAGF